MIEFKMPSLGADMEDGTLQEWRVKPGDHVKRGDIIADVETQKGLIEIEVFDEGQIKELTIHENEKVPVGTTMALIQPEHEKVSVKVPEKEPVEQVAEPILEEKVTPIVTHHIEGERIKISPLARKMAEANNLDLHKIHGSGEHGEIHKSDIEKVLAGAGNGEMKEADTVREHPNKDLKESMRKAIASATSRSNREIPHYYLEMTIDMNPAISWLSDLNKELPIKQRILPVVLLIKAVANALKKVPELNAIWEEKVVLKNDINIALAVALRDGGVVMPTIHEVDKKSIEQIMGDLSDIVPRAKNFKLRSSDLNESTISITSIGDNGADRIAGVIFPPHVAIIGFGAIREIPWAADGMLDVRHAVTVTLSADHRVTDGYTGDRFLTELKNQLQKPEEL